MIHKSLKAIYCDDIRNEIGGKQSFMGVYNADMIFPTFPAVLPKFCAHVSLKLPHSETPKKNVNVRLLNGEEVLAEAVIDEAALAATPLPPPDTDIAPEDRTLVMGLSFMISPFQIEAPTRIRLRANVDGEELKGNSLKVRLPTAEERLTMGFPPEQ